MHISAMQLRHPVRIRECHQNANVYMLVSNELYKEMQTVVSLRVLEKPDLDMTARDSSRRKVARLYL